MYRTNLLMKLLNRSVIMRTTSANSRRKRWILAGFTLFLSVVLAFPATAQVNKDKDKKDNRKTKQTVAMSQPIYEGLMEIQESLEAGDSVAAREGIAKLLEKKKLSPY